MTVEPRPLRALIVDDEKPGRDALRSALATYQDITVIDECATGAEAIGSIRKEDPDVVFLDVQMPEVDGFGVIAGVGVDRMPPVVLVTAHDHFALKAFDVHAVDYLLKPYTRSRLREAIDRVRAMYDRGEDAVRVHRAALTSMMRAGAGGAGDADDVALPSEPGYAARLLVKRGDRIRFVAVDSVDYFEACGSYVDLHVGKEKHRVRRTMRDIQSQLDPRRFVRIHRSTIVNVEHIKEVQPWFNGDYVALLHNGEQLRVSRVYRDDLLRPQF
jgi:two-component system LytT family response regulator